MLHPDLTIVGASDAYLRATKTERAAIMGRGIFDVFPDNPEDPDATGTTNLRASLDRVRQTLAADTMAIQKYDIRRPDSEGGGFEERHWSPVNSPVLGPDGALRYIIHRVEDVTEFVRLQRLESEHQHRAERFLDSIVEAIPNMVFVKDAETLRFVRFNKAGEKLLGLRREDLIGRSDWDLFPNQEAEAFVQKDREVLQGGAVVEIPEEPIHTAHGLRYLRTRKVPILNETGAPLYLLGISEDITETRRSAEELAEALGAAETANRAKSEFLARMSHELRTPLNSIIGFSEVLIDGTFGALNDKQRRYVTNVLTSGRQLLELINDILDLSKIEAGRMDLTLKPMSLAAIVSEVQAQLAPLAERKDLGFTANVQDDLPPITADGPRLRQMLYNLVTNAIKYTARGNVRVMACRATGDSSRPGEWIELAVADTGIGIAAADQKRVFGEFEQVASDYVRSQQGTGLGLAVTRHLVDMHGGQIVLESTPGVGSVFRLFLPIGGPEQVHAQGGRRAASALVPEGDAPLVLVVEDEPTAADLLSHYLRESGYRVMVAQTGAAALELAPRTLPQVITLDIQLPDRDGHQVLAKLKSDPRTRSIPVIVASITEERAQGQALGVADWFVKPVTREMLLASVARLAPCTKAKTEKRP